MLAKNKRALLPYSIDQEFATDTDSCSTAQINVAQHPHTPGRWRQSKIQAPHGRFRITDIAGHSCKPDMIFNRRDHCTDIVES